MVINTNVEAQRTANNLNVSQTNLAKSLSRLSSGSKIVNPSDDAAGLAVSSRLRSTIKRLDSALSNVVNAVSFTQTQDGFMKTVDKAFRRMGELAMLARDETKSIEDRKLYDQEFQQLKDYINDTTGKQFNSVNLFDGTEIAVTIDADGDVFNMPGIDMTALAYANALEQGDQITESISMSAATDTLTKTAHGFSAGDKLVLDAPLPAPVSSDTAEYYVGSVTANSFKLYTSSAAAIAGTANTEVDFTDDAFNLSVVGPPSSGTMTDTITRGVHIRTATAAESAITLVKTAISRVATDRAALGAVQSRLNFTNEQLAVTKENLSSAISRIADVDVAEEATSYARYQILVQSGTQMLTQANNLPNAALSLLRG